MKTPRGDGIGSTAAHSTALCFGEERVYNLVYTFQGRRTSPTDRIHGRRLNVAGGDTNHQSTLKKNRN